MIIKSTIDKLFPKLINSELKNKIEEGLNISGVVTIMITYILDGFKIDAYPGNIIDNFSVVWDNAFPVCVIYKEDVVPNSNRIRIDNMSNGELAEFVFGDELHNVSTSKDEFTQWLNQNYDPNYRYNIAAITISKGEIVLTTCGFKYGDIQKDDRLELFPINGIIYTLIVTDIITPMYVGEPFFAKAIFENSNNVPLSILSNLQYRKFRVV